MPYRNLSKTDRWLLAFALVFGTATFIAGIAFAIIGV
jgi:hypothetical protein